MGYEPGLQPEAKHIAIKMPVFSFEKIRGADISAADLLEGEYRHLNGNVFCLWLKTRLIAHILQFVSKDYLGCQRYDRDSGNLADIRYGTAGTRVNLNYIYVIPKNNELDICLLYTSCISLSFAARYA